MTRLDSDQWHLEQLVMFGESRIWWLKKNWPKLFKPSCSSLVSMICQQTCLITHTNHQQWAGEKHRWKQWQQKARRLLLCPPQMPGNFFNGTCVSEKVNSFFWWSQSKLTHVLWWQESRIILLGAAERPGDNVHWYAAVRCWHTTRHNRHSRWH